MSKHVYLIDGYGFVFRAYHVLPPLTNPAGTPVGAVMGFCSMLHRLLERIRAQQKSSDQQVFVGVILDAGQKNFRHDLDARYKANRPEAPEDLKPQFPLIRDASEAFNVATVDAPGYEADDLIATYAKQASAEGMQVTIVSSDKDLMQLVGDGVSMYDPVKDRRIEAKQVEEKFGVPPEKVRDVLALMGDASDNVPGVPGIGPKTAAELIQNYGTLENLYQHLDEIKQPKRRQTLIDAKEDAFLSYKLVGLHENAPAPALDTLTFHELDADKLVTFCDLHGFSALKKRLVKGAGPTPVPMAAAAISADAAPAKKEAVQVHEEKLASISELGAWLKQYASGAVAVMADKEQVSLAVSPSQMAVLALESKPKDDLFAAAEQDDKQQLHSVLEKISALKRPVVAFNAKPFLHVLPGLDVHDVALMVYALKGSIKGIEIEHAAALYAEYEDSLNALFAQKLARVYWRIDQPLQASIVAMEQRGIKIDASFLLQLSQRFGQQMVELEQKIYTQAGREFNIGSPKQLGEILFDELGFSGGKKSAKSGAYGTDADVLERLAAEGHQIAADVHLWRGFSKLKNTYTDALPKVVNQQTGRVHTTFNMTATSTGRLSSEAPNLQNIPIRTTEGREIRKAFVAEEGNMLIAADYSQIELRLLAHVAGIDSLKTAFKNGIDIHRQTAAQVFGLKSEEVTKEQRRSAKAINFGIIYGQSAFGLAASLGIGRDKAKRYIEAYFQQFPGIQNYMEETKEFARTHGYVETILGRKCYTPLINDKNGARRQFAERAAINAPLQGSAADIIKKAMIEVHKQGINLLLQVHDELILECPEAQAEQTAKKVQNIMESAVSLTVPLTVDVRVSASWG